MTAPVDLTGETFVTGTGSDSPGGVTAASAAGGAGAGDPRAASGANAASDVSLADPSWSCPWPREADAEQINEHTVVIRVVVGAEGNAESAEVILDPGGGFAQAAVACALRTRFTPAHDRENKPVRARSPPIKVRFTR